MRQLRLWLGERELACQPMQLGWQGWQPAGPLRRQACPGGDQLASAVARLQHAGPLPRRWHWVLADSHCRFLLQPRPAGLASHAELQLLLARGFEQHFGVSAADWIWRSDSRPGASQDLLCALPRLLQAQILAATASHGARLCSLRPLWLWCAARLSRAQCAGGGWLLCRAGQQQTVGLLWAGQWCSLRSSPADSLPLPTLLARESLLHGLCDAPAQVWQWGGRPESAAGLQLFHQALPGGWEGQTA